MEIGKKSEQSIGKCLTVRPIRLEEFFFCDMRMIYLIVFIRKGLPLSTSHFCLVSIWLEIWGHTTFSKITSMNLIKIMCLKSKILVVYFTTYSEKKCNKTVLCKEGCTAVFLVVQVHISNWNGFEPSLHFFVERVIA